jgi:hypothetical protein
LCEKIGHFLAFWLLWSNFDVEIVQLLQDLPIIPRL